MRANKIALAIVPAVLMASLCLVLTGIEAWLSKFGTTPNARLVLGRVGIALPYVVAAAIGVVFLLAAAGATAIRSAGWSVVFGGLLVVAIAVSRAPIPSPMPCSLETAFSPMPIPRPSSGRQSLRSWPCSGCVWL